ncbi:MAG: AtpZ/AtpI family protein [Pirellulales bacterium]|nr:AtpZ/AtpI family protein [Pirellulales bacterium]
MTTISAEMALPGLGGYWLDRQLGTSMVFLILGVLLGLAAGMWHLLRLASEIPSGRNGHTGGHGSRPPGPH